MKRFTLTILTLAIAIGIVPTSIYPVDITKDGVTIRVTNEQDRSEKLKDHDLLCFYVRIKNDTGAAIELPKYAVSSSITASESHLTEIMGSMPREVGKYFARFFVGTGLQLTPFLALGISGDNGYYGRDAKDLICTIAMIGCITSPITGLTWATKNLIHRTQIFSMIQEYLDRQATTIQPDREHGFYIYVHLEQYNRSIGKKITVKLHRKDTDHAIVCDIDTTDVMQTQTA